MKEFTHRELVARASRWLRSVYKCKAVFEEFPSPSGEIPDAIGWKRNGRSVMIECKVSRSDYLADAHKPHRQNLNIAVGAERYYLAPPKTIAPNEIPEDWGLLETRGRGITVVKHARPRKDLRSEVGMKYEMRMLVAALNRVQVRLGSASLTDWLKIENKDLSPAQMQSFAPPKSDEDMLAAAGWQRVVFDVSLPVDEVTDEPYCPIHEEAFHKCACMKPYEPDCDYKWADGALYGRKRVLQLDGEPCDHPGCLNHVTHPGEGCGRIAGHTPLVANSPARIM